MRAEYKLETPPPTSVLEAIRNRKSIPDERLATLSYFVEHMADSRGMPTTDEVKTFLAAGFKEEHILQIILAIAVKTLSNYCNHVAQPDIDTAFAEYR